ncbi:ROK family protein [Spiractinospora alimapuensis]|uniref:ROK family protein n=1 Tax=Spiractinospora alimapuensis TaxID=2820884 RepID=UPI001F1F292B|nr:ROK family protein [Spiractinospora alimapuensis]QVQ52773.1 ROK family protein [Spiractinospora alimapuensis]
MSTTDNALGSVELLPGSVRAAVLERDGGVRHLVEATFDPSVPGAVRDTLTDVVQRCFTFHRVTGIGVACPGLVDTVAGTVVSCYDLPELNDFPLTSVVSASGRAPAYVEHRARLQVLGDRWFGHGRGRREFASVSTGETLGVGLLYEGRIIAPPGGRSGAHMVVAADGEVCTCGATGCWRTVATSRWLRDAAARSGYAAGDLPTLTEMAEAGESRAAHLLDDYADNLALGLANIQQLFAPGRFILHGEARWAGPAFLDRIERRLRAVTAWNAEAEPPHVLVADVDEDDSTLLGAAGLVLSQAS